MILAEILKLPSFLANLYNIIVQIFKFFDIVEFLYLELVKLKTVDDIN